MMSRSAFPLIPQDSDHAFGEFHRRGMTRVGLDVDAENLTGAVRLYERAGMRIVKRRDTYEKLL